MSQPEPPQPSRSSSPLRARLQQIAEVVIVFRLCEPGAMVNTIHPDRRHRNPVRPLPPSPSPILAHHELAQPSLFRARPRLSCAAATVAEKGLFPDYVTRVRWSSPSTQIRPTVAQPQRPPGTRIIGGTGSQTRPLYSVHASTKPDSSSFVC